MVVWQWGCRTAILAALVPLPGGEASAQGLLTPHTPILDFGQVPVGRSRVLELRLVNGGVDPIWIEEIGVAGVAFDVPAPPVTAAAVLIPASDSLVFAVVFAAPGAGAHGGRVDILTATDTVSLELAAQATAVVVDEVLADPPPGAAGDANGDGTRSSYQDEFVELFNSGPDTVAMSGWRLGDDDAAAASWFAFPAGTQIAPGGRLVVFGGGAPVALGDTVFSDDGRIGDGLSNSGDRLFLVDADGDTADVVEGVDWNDNQSVGGHFVTSYPTVI